MTESNAVEIGPIDSGISIGENTGPILSTGFTQTIPDWLTHTTDGSVGVDRNFALAPSDPQCRALTNQVAAKTEIDHTKQVRLSSEDTRILSAISSKKSQARPQKSLQQITRFNDVDFHETIANLQPRRLENYPTHPQTRPNLFRLSPVASSFIAGVLLMIKKFALVLAWVALAAGSAGAGTITVSGTYSDLADSSSTGISFTGFNENLGTLTGISMTLNGTLTAEIDIYNGQDRPETFTNATASNSVTISGPGLTSFLISVTSADLRDIAPGLASSAYPGNIGTGSDSATVLPANFFFRLMMGFGVVGRRHG